MCLKLQGGRQFIVNERKIKFNNRSAHKSMRLFCWQLINSINSIEA
jgi:hypothetical protein